MPTKLQSVLALLLAVLVGGGIVYGAIQLQKGQQKNSVLGAQQEVVTVINQVGKLIELPGGETPTIATVSDIAKLKGQPFFSNAKNGDKVLIYTQAKEAILYRPSENKIVKVAPVNIQNTPTPVPSTIVTVTPTPTLKPKPTAFFRPATPTSAISPDAVTNTPAAPTLTP